MTSFFVHAFPLFQLHTYSPNTCHILLYDSAKVSLTPETFPGPPDTGQGDLLCRPIATCISQIRNPDVQFRNYLLINHIPHPGAMKAGHISFLFTVPTSPWFWLKHSVSITEGMLALCKYNLPWEGL